MTVTLVIIPHGDGEDAVRALLLRGSMSPHGNHSACLEVAVAFSRGEMHTQAKEAGLAQLRFLPHGANPLELCDQKAGPLVASYSRRVVFLTGDSTLGIQIFP